MNILWLTWKDCENPESGGAELVNEAIAAKLSDSGHKIIFIVAGWKSCAGEIDKNGFNVIRLGNKYTVYFLAALYYLRFLKGWSEIILDECNTVPFFAKYYAKCKTVFVIQQFARKIWFYQMPFPLSVIGYLLEPIYIRMFNDQITITFAQSTKTDLINYGYSKKNILISSEVFNLKPITNLSSVKKNSEPTILFFSSLRKMKRPEHVIEAFEIAKKKIPFLKLEIAGGGDTRDLTFIKNKVKSSPYSEDIKFHGQISDEKLKIKIMSRCHFICCTSVREGWGIIVTEAGSQGTPAIVYGVNGLKDAVDYGRTGLVCKINTPKGLADTIQLGFDKDFNYSQMQINALNFASYVDVKNAAIVFQTALDLVS